MLLVHKPLKKATHKLTGVNTSSVNLATEKMVVEYDPSRLNISDITQAVSDSGYEAHEESNCGHGGLRPRKETE